MDTIRPTQALSEPRPTAHRRRRRLSLPAAAAAAALVVLAFAGCAGATPEPSARAGGLPVVAGDIQGKVDTSKDPVRVVVKSDSKNLLADIKKELEDAGFTVYPSASDSVGAKNDKYYVSVSISGGQATYVFTRRD